MHAFRRTRHGYVTRLDAVERSIIGSVVGDVATLLGYGVGEGDARPAEEGEGEPDDLAGMPELSWSEPDDAAARLPQDPALARLLPSASADDDVAAEVRRLTEDSIRSAKGERLRRVWWDLRTPRDEIRVPPERAMVWAGALTDVRLVLAQRLGVESADDAAALEQVATSGSDDVSRALASLYVALSWLQESLVEAMLKELPEPE